MFCLSFSKKNVIGNGDDDDIFTSDFPRDFYTAYGIDRDIKM